MVDGRPSKRRPGDAEPPCETRPMRLTNPPGILSPVLFPRPFWYAAYQAVEKRDWLRCANPSSLRRTYCMYASFPGIRHAARVADISSFLNSLLETMSINGLTYGFPAGALLAPSPADFAPRRPPILALNEETPVEPVDRQPAFAPAMPPQAIPACAEGS